jgi:tetratricopeptide (TPR) repeat protein
LTRKYLLLLLLLAGAALIVLMYARRPNQRAPIQGEHASPASLEPVVSGYADPGACAVCHGEIARTYSLTGMARSFSRLRPDSARLGGAAGALADFKNRNRVYHAASDRHYTMIERNGRFYQRRHQIGFEGTEANALELEAHYVVGSGNHARTLVHRKADGRLAQMPVSWYAERGVRLRADTPIDSARQGYWAMSPGYDKPAHLDFRRVIDAGCMSCHNGYTRAPVQHDLEGPKFDDPLPEGIDCQRCHGPGRAHVDAIKGGDLEAGLRAIVNPAKLNRERQLEACMQCHLESTSSPLPFQIRRYEHPPFSYTPGKALGDYFIHFDHAPGTPSRDDKFEIASGAYRLRKSACFQRSEMTCGTCHDPHDIPRGPNAVDRYVAVCRSCHEQPHRNGVPQVAGVRASATCIDCHMPKRRAEDAVHVVMTDHYIQRQRARRDLLAPRTEAESLEGGNYRGEVVLYYPPTLPATPENDLYLALAQVQQGSNLTAGIRRLEDTIGRQRPARPEFYYELARAYSRTANYDAAIRWCREALRRDATFVPALKELASAATTKGTLVEAGEALEKAVALRPSDGNAFADLGSVYLRQGRLDDAENALQRALALDPAMPLANNMMGLAALRTGNGEVAERYLREAIRHQPDLAEAHNNLGNLLAGRKAYAEAAHHFEKAIAGNPNYVEAHHSYGLVLALTHAYAKAAAELQVVVRLAPGLAAARVDLADVLATMGRVEEATREYAIAANSNDAAAREAAQAGLRALRR